MRLEQNRYEHMLRTFEKLKMSMSEWVVALDTKQYALEQKLKDLEMQIRSLKN